MVLLELFLIFSLKQTLTNKFSFFAGTTLLCGLFEIVYFM